MQIIFFIYGYIGPQRNLLSRNTNISLYRVHHLKKKA